MRKISVLFMFLTVGLFILCAAPPVFCQSFETDAEIMPVDANDLNNDADVYLETTTDEKLFPKPARKGTLIVINSSSYCADGTLDGKSLFTNLQPGYKVTFTRQIPYGSHKLEAKQCSGGSIRWNPVTYTQGSSYTITLTN